MTLQAPFPYFGGKSRVAPLVWQALGQPEHYIEPFAGSAAVLLRRPGYDPARHMETVNDADGFITNVWRGIKHAPDLVAYWADNPVNHWDLNARRRELLANVERLTDGLTNESPEWCDPKLAGYYVWCASTWIGSGLTLKAIPHLGSKGMGVNKSSLGQRPHLADKGMGVNKSTLGQSPHLSHKGMGVNRITVNIREWMDALSDRLRKVRIFCGDWTRTCAGDWQDSNWKTVGIFFDPPYGVTDRSDVYGVDSWDVAHAVREWSIERGKRPHYRIVIAGYDEHAEELEAAGWTVRRWKAQGGYSNLGHGRGRQNKARECLYLSPGCHNGELF